MSETPHIPVLLKEMLGALEPQNGKTYVDATFGAGGYSSAILEAADCKLYAFDRDESVRPYADALEKKYPGRFKLIIAPFSRMKSELGSEGVYEIDGVVFDIGVSSMQLDQAERGFSFSRDGALDMRMGQHGKTAADLINHEDEREIANAIFNYGEERKARRIAAKIVEERAKEPITTTARLADIVASVVGRAEKIHPATRTFQAIRIWVNDELGELKTALSSAAEMVKQGGRIVVVTFHSLEDRIVKNFFSPKIFTSRHQPLVSKSLQYNPFKSIHGKPVVASETEQSKNPRSRSAKLRSYIKQPVEALP